MVNQLMPQVAPAQQQPAPAPQIDPAQVADARAHMGVMTKALMALAAKPRGSLTKQDLFSAAADMIADGAFSTPQAKQQLVAEIAQTPDDEASIRQAVGSHLLQLAQIREFLHQHFGAEG